MTRKDKFELRVAIARLEILARQCGVIEALGVETPASKGFAAELEAVRRAIERKLAWEHG